ncbi:membrane lipoprotein lipid attachment site-containing protein [Vibrio harveyi]|uniref:membrane lipoprotein lipid attachment site-containing protein n=1 Tax=Vibrio harveyi group TaxID=717610 RepID=UPI0023802DDA|nr:membrane lipoprotein lipid attachment site-containing protein [Vibrio harveyi]
MKKLIITFLTVFILAGCASTDNKPKCYVKLKPIHSSIFSNSQPVFEISGIFQRFGENTYRIRGNKWGKFVGQDDVAEVFPSVEECERYWLF